MENNTYKHLSIEWVFISLILLYLCTNIFFTYVADNYLSSFSYSLIVVASIAIILILRLVIDTYDVRMISCAGIWVLWFFVCLSGKSEFVNYRNMVIAIGATIILGYLIFTKYEPNMLVPICIIVFATITIIISLGYLETNELIVREIATGESEYKGLGIGGYDFAYCLALLTPCIIHHIKHSKKVIRIVLIAFFVLLEYYFLSCGLVTTLLISILGVCIWLIVSLENKQLRNFLLVVAFAVTLFMLTAGTELLSDALSNVNIDNTVIQDKLSDIVSSLNGESESHGTISGRVSRYELSFNGFLASPLWGWLIGADTSLYSGGHSTLLDYLSMTGIIGFILYFIMLHELYKGIASRVTSEDGLRCIRISFLLFLMASALKGTNYASIMFVMSIAMPLYTIAVENTCLKQSQEFDDRYEDSTN